MRTFLALVLVLVVGFAQAQQSNDPQLPTIDAHEAQMAELRQQKEIIDMNLEIAQKRKTLAELGEDGATAPTAPSFPRLVRLISYAGKTYGEFAIGSASVRAMAGDYVNASWRVERFEKNAAILMNSNSGDKHTAVLGAGAQNIESRPIQPPAPPASSMQEG